MKRTVGIPAPCVSPESAQAFIFGERARSGPKGIVGGGDAALNVFEYQQGDQWLTPAMGAKMRGIALKRGERVRLQTPGGGGWGLVTDRRAEDIAHDEAMGYVSSTQSIHHGDAS